MKLTIEGKENVQPEAQLKKTEKQEKFPVPKIDENATENKVSW